MKGSGIIFSGIMMIMMGSPLGAQNGLSRAEQNERLLYRLKEVFNLTPSQDSSVRAIFRNSEYIGQGNPAITVHPAAKEQCEGKLQSEGISDENSAFERICGGKYMAPLYDPEKEKPEDAVACMDQFEFPDIPCEYPVVWVRAREAALLCEALGKRICDAHEWEGGCEGRLLPPDYPYTLTEGKTPEEAIRAMRQAHNREFRAGKTWAYGDHYEKGVCAAASFKTSGCTGGSWSKCGSNTYPSGYFPKCKSALGFYDMHGNAAEHMNLPLNESEMSSRGSTTLGYTEMKGSWFIFDTYHAHEDWCRWRAPFWHGSRVMALDSHRNYHLGFRCCKTIGPGIH
jgi:hypothetical protein